MLISSLLSIPWTGRPYGEPSVELEPQNHSSTSSRTFTKVATPKSGLAAAFLPRSRLGLALVLAPALFFQAVDWILKETLSHSGLSVPYHHVTDIDYADDIATMDSIQAVLADTLQRMEGACSALGLPISWAKPKGQNIGVGPSATDIIVGNQTVQGVQDFVYLGSQIGSASGSCTEQHRRIGIASGTMQRLHHVWHQCHITPSTKLCLYSTLVLPVLLYASKSGRQQNRT